MRDGMSRALRVVRLHNVLWPAAVKGVGSVQNGPVGGSSAREGNTSN
jgi:hypothetical protein